MKKSVVGWLFTWKATKDKACADAHGGDTTWRYNMQTGTCQQYT
jgi:hypothetical protein